MSDLMREEFEKEWGLPSEAQGLRFIPELNIYGFDMYKDKETADRKSSSWFYFQKAWKLSRELLVIELPIPVDFPDGTGDYHQMIDPDDLIDSIHAVGVKTK